MIGIKILFFIGIISPALTHPFYHNQQQLQDYDNNQYDADGFVFDGPADRPNSFPNSMITSLSNPSTKSTTTRSPISNTTPTLATTTTPSPEYTACIRKCQVTVEYNPVCGSDNQVYNNPAHLRCSATCGNNVQFRNSGRCTSPGQRG